MPLRVDNHVAEIRRSRGLGAPTLAEMAGVSRQTIYAIEAGTYLPNTEVTLKLARALNVAVEELFSLPADKPGPARRVKAELLSGASPFEGQAVRVCKVGERVLAIPVNATPYYLPEADGVIAGTGRRQGKTELTILPGEESRANKRIVLAGCDPAIGIVSGIVEKLGGVEVVSAAAASRLALTWLHEGKVHIAGSHLEDPETGEFNLPYLRREFPGEDFAVMTFARWEEGLVTAPGNPKHLRAAGDLARRGVRFVNREPGSGSRVLLERLLAEAGVAPAKVSGFDRVAYGHLAAAYVVHASEADCCLATRSAAQSFGLDFVPMRSERYDFVMRRKTLELPEVQVFLDLLQRATLRRKLEMLAGYDTAQTGALLA